MVVSYVNFQFLMSNVNMDIFLKIIQKIVFIFHFQTNFDLHIVINMFVKFHDVVKFLLIDNLIDMKIQSCFQTTSVFHDKNGIFFVIKGF
jgi:hypothetical protein